MPLNGRLGQTVDYGGALYGLVHTVNGTELIRHRRGTDRLETLLGDRDLPLPTFDDIIRSTPIHEAQELLTEVATCLREAFLTGGTNPDGTTWAPIALSHAVVTEVESEGSTWSEIRLSVSYTHQSRPGVTFVRYIQLFNEVGDPCGGDPVISLMEDLDTGRIPPERLYRFDHLGRVVTYDHPQPL
jgi:hypothetical protein